MLPRGLTRSRSPRASSSSTAAAAAAPGHLGRLGSSRTPPGPGRGAPADRRRGRRPSTWPGPGSTCTRERPGTRPGSSTARQQQQQQQQGLKQLDPRRGLNSLDHQDTGLDGSTTRTRVSTGSTTGRVVLSRIAESLFWIGRYVERADVTARILDVQTQLRHRGPSSSTSRSPADCCWASSASSTTARSSSAAMLRLSAVGPRVRRLIVATLEAARESASRAARRCRPTMSSAIDTTWRTISAARCPGCAPPWPSTGSGNGAGDERRRRHHHEPRQPGTSTCSDAASSGRHDRSSAHAPRPSSASPPSRSTRPSAPAGLRVVPAYLGRDRGR